MEDDPDFGYYCETDDDGVTPVTKKKLIQYLEILRGTCLTVLLLLSYRSRTSILASLFSEDGSLSLFCMGPVSRRSREVFVSEKPVVKLQSTCFEKMIFKHIFIVKETKRIAKFDGLEPRRCKDIKLIVAPEMGPKSFGTFGRQTPALSFFRERT